MIARSRISEFFVFAIKWRQLILFVIFKILFQKKMTGLRLLITTTQLLLGCLVKSAELICVFSLDSKKEVDVYIIIIDYELPKFFVIPRKKFMEH